MKLPEPVPRRTLDSVKRQRRMMLGQVRWKMSECILCPLRNRASNRDHQPNQHHLSELWLSVDFFLVSDTYKVVVVGRVFLSLGRMAVEKEQGKDVLSTTYNTDRGYDFTSTRGETATQRISNTRSVALFLTQLTLTTQHIGILVDFQIPQHKIRSHSWT